MTVGYVHCARFITYSLSKEIQEVCSLGGAILSQPGEICLQGSSGLHCEINWGGSIVMVQQGAFNDQETKPRFGTGNLTNKKPTWTFTRATFLVLGWVARTRSASCPWWGTVAGSGTLLLSGTLGLTAIAERTPRSPVSCLVWNSRRKQGQ